MKYTHTLNISGNDYPELNLTWDGKPVEVVGIGIFLSVIKYKNIYVDQQFHVCTMDLELQNNISLKEYMSFS